MERCLLELFKDSRAFCCGMFVNIIYDTVYLYYVFKDKISTALVR